MMHQVFELPWNIKSNEVLANLARRFATNPPTRQRDRLTFLDTFDWRLYQRGLTLVRTGESHQLRSIDDANVIESATGGDDPRFWWDFPAGGLRERLRRILKERAVIVVGDLALRSRRLGILNADDKTVARVAVQVGEAYCDGRSAARIRTLAVNPLKGYTKESKKVTRYLMDTGLRLARRNAFDAAVAACGREPGDYSSKLDLHLEASMTGRQATGVIFGHLVDTMQRNVDGIRKDIDTEFLHDFRVAIRRTRSGLSQLKIALPDVVAAEFSKRFAELGRSTNRLRDLDVYLLSRDQYYGMLSDDLKHGLDPLFDRLEKERKTHHESLVRTVEASSYRELVGEWRQVLRTFTDPDTTDEFAVVPVGQLARKVIRKRHNRVIRNGSRIGDDTPDSSLHSLRIDCKKLRYMLEFFASLYPPKIVGGFVKQLKRLQDNLGEFNDLSVQQSELRSFLQTAGADASVATAAAIGALVAKLEHRQQVVRLQFAAAFDSFAGPQNQKRFDKMFVVHKS
ncbi:MAG: CHAD domain-containing protein [Candidatus Latescibacterota bacterium]|nr:MAG: CHAD domain-containing protein [Candidatus Latescibacterota bacterium]